MKNDIDNEGLRTRDIIEENSLEFGSKEDKLNRKGIAENLTKIIQNRNEPFVLSIDSSWGTGKTWLIKMWKNALKNGKKDTILPIYFNAWENDDFDDPLLSIIAKLIEAEKKVKNKKEIIEEVKKYATPIIKSVLMNIVDKTTLGIINQDTLEEIHKSGKQEKDIFDKYEDYKLNKSMLIQILEKFQKNEDKKIIFFIDELDRCRPSFAIETLERIKHFFNISGYVFVLSVDKEQLSYSIETLYGQKMDAQGYLRRFIDLEYKLPEPDHNSYIEHLKCKYNLSEFYLGNDYPDFWKYLSICIKSFDFKLRDTDKLFKYLSIVLTNINFYRFEKNNRSKYKAYNTMFYFEILAYLTTLRISNNSVYKKIFSNVISIEEFEIESQEYYEEAKFDQLPTEAIDGYTPYMFLKEFVISFIKFYKQLQRNTILGIPSNANNGFLNLRFANGIESFEIDLSIFLFKPDDGDKYYQIEILRTLDFLDDFEV